MAPAEAVQRAGRNDFDELMEMLLTCFRAQQPDHPHFDHLFPDMYRATEEDMGCNYVIRRAGRIVSCVGLFPIPVWVCNRRVLIAGIGGVSTVPEFRGQGLMHTLMGHVQSAIVEQGYAFSWLGGDRRRYMPWGYEAVTNRFHFTLNSRAPGFGRFAKLVPEPMNLCDVDRSDWAMIWRQVQENPKISVCDEERVRLKYKRIGQKVFYTGRDDGAHIVVHESSESKTLVAWAGRPELIGGLIAGYIASPEELDRHNLEVFLPWYPDKYCPIFKELMVDYSMARGGNVAIVDLEKTFNMFKPYFDQRVREFDLKGHAVVRVNGAGKLPAQQVTLAADGRELAILPAGGDRGPCVELDRWQVVELMFTPLLVGYSQRLDRRVRWLTQLFPVPFYLPDVFGV